MGVPTSEVGYTPAMPRREDREVHKGHVVALEKKIEKSQELGTANPTWKMQVLLPLVSVITEVCLTSLSD